jgi:hypothetical protein
VRQCLFSFATMERSAYLADNPCRSGERKVDLHGDGKTRMSPEHLGRSGIAFRHGFIQNQRQKFVPPQSC